MSIKHMITAWTVGTGKALKRREERQLDKDRRKEKSTPTSKNIGNKGRVRENIPFPGLPLSLSLSVSFALQESTPSPQYASQYICTHSIYLPIISLQCHVPIMTLSFLFNHPVHPSRQLQITTTVAFSTSTAAPTNKVPSTHKKPNDSKRKLGRRLLLKKQKERRRAD